MDPLEERGADAPASDTVAPGATDDVREEGPSGSSLDRYLTYALWGVGVLLVALAGYFGYSVWAQQQAEIAASPALQVIQALRKQVAEKPNDPTLRSRLAEALGAAGKFDEAKAELVAAIKLNKDYAGAYQNLAMIEMLTKDYDNAELHLKKLLELSSAGDYQNVNQRREIALYYLGEIALIEKRWEDAVGYFKSAIRVRKDASDTYLRLAQAYVGLGDISSAKEQIGIALTFDPRFPEAHYELGRILAKEGDTVDAAWEFRAALDAKPDAAQAEEALDAIGSYDEFFEKAVAAEKAGDLKAAFDAVRISRALDPSSFEAAMLHGRLAERRGDPADAAEAYRTATKIKPEDADAAAALARTDQAAKKKGGAK